MPATDKQTKPNELVSRQSGFSLHARVACKSNQRKKLERFCRYITRPAIAEQRLSLASNGNVIAERRPVALKTPYDDGTSHVAPAARLSKCGGPVRVIARSLCNSGEASS